MGQLHWARVDRVINPPPPGGLPAQWARTLMSEGYFGMRDLKNKKKDGTRT